MNAKALLLLFVPVPTLATVATVATAGAQDQARPRLVHHRIVAGDFDGDGRAEVVTWDSRSQQLTVVGLVGGKRQQLANHHLDDFPNAMRATDLDGDGKDELVVGSGRRGYNRKGQPVVDIRVRVYRPLGPEGDGWTPEQVFRKASDRPTVTALDVVDLDGDRRPELLFACFVEKYFTEVYVARQRQDGKDRDDGATWSVKSRGRIRMGMNVIAADAVTPRAPVLVVGRPYGEKLGDLGDAFLLPAGKERVPLPAFRGVSALAAGDIDGDGRPELVAGDGWHQSYGRLARARLTVIRRLDGAFQATPVDRWRTCRPTSASSRSWCATSTAMAVARSWYGAPGRARWAVMSGCTSGQPRVGAAARWRPMSRASRSAASRVAPCPRSSSLVATRPRSRCLWDPTRVGTCGSRRRQTRSKWTPRRSSASRRRRSRSMPGSAERPP
ncbi:MAG: FG-GAP and VCBS repeat-containing protein, partial [Planctomycetota bacterium]